MRRCAFIRQRGSVAAGGTGAAVGPWSVIDYLPCKVEMYSINPSMRARTTASIAS
jgi:hypothetical protein